jgi:peptidyl-prolyl cis-trans isomerase SurA
VQEYHDGILLFDLTDRMVWTKAVEDSAGLEAYYAEHKDNYMWEKRMDATLYTSRDREVADFAHTLISGQRRKSLSPEEIVSRTITEFNDSTCIEFENRKLEMGDHPLSDEMNWSQDKLSPVKTQNGKEIFLVKNKILKPTGKELDECRGLVTADYQNYLEKEWIETLRAKYPVSVNEELLSTID